MHISSLLEKFKKYGVGELLTKETIAEFLSKQYSVPFTSRDIVIKDAIVTVKAPPAIKSDIFIKKKQLLDVIKEKLPSLVVTDIR